MVVGRVGLGKEDFWDVEKPCEGKEVYPAAHLGGIEREDCEKTVEKNDRQMLCSTVVYAETGIYLGH